MFNVLSFFSNGTQDLIDDLLLPVLNCVTTHLIPVLNDEVKVLGADVKNLTGSTAQEYESTGFVAEDGALAGGDSLVGTSALISLRSGHPGRSGRGRMFIPGIDEESLDGSALDATFLAAAAAFIGCMAAAFFVGDPPATPQFVWVLHSRKDNAFYPLTQGIPREFASFLRSRRQTGP